ncbi:MULTISPECIES: tRNA (guanosine(37)-N1)-methyltransferase TrmD [Dictyoglomus]|jgi:tRNA (guanine37-N1)-methyltransferase|uniref:tRNA (guanine-N(1)-)-methyltransferase n=1 Tax=Dictyoglomus turgidum (strain DSM 6724 / Z-1310) TaxID=515635 RepID=TRMD_DICTD|nr:MULTISPECIES: tRNA (guanosine(37)-N1)-methyltransferase TrmD [Dictyoglomus]B8E2G4.1 RecName: Full=tRNA (guanine-N(1)-)-methyltransferase; AltName: Full=M1G-methyltransferase; AltName: Full=tRNA [GM37] methyltransferase [Dictyoglomus turgidum DSM 6724]ACK42808.1 tRNA (guanine-N1)-methyltransferase [Dictyoglomus turgidum DSM 6724]HBU30867.1 tRNA (guanosine(37)-N1)-methyltransferase TrmD [Dictyoglomus sp.]
MLRIDIVTIFPEMFKGPFDVSILKKAQDKGLVEIKVYNLRDFTEDKHRTVDDYPYGGGSGMVMKPEPIFKAVRSLKKEDSEVILLSPSGDLFNQKIAEELSKKNHLILICGRYEGVDERVKSIITREISIGDYVLTGGEIPAMVIVDAVVRLVPGVLGDPDSLREESFQWGILEYPQYTHPRDFEGMKVPDILLSGNHERIRRWRRKEALKKTFLKRPDLLEKTSLTQEDLELLEEIKKELREEV